MGNVEEYISLQLPKKKRKKWEQKQLCNKIKEAFMTHGLRIVMAKDWENDESESGINDIGPDCSVLIHKFNPLLGDVWSGEKYAIDKYKQLIKQYDVSGIIVIDPLPNVLQVINRHKLYNMLQNSRVFHLAVAGKRICLPKTVSVSKYDGQNIITNKQLVASSDISYPCMFKPLIANGEEKSHQLALILDDQGLSTVDGDGVIQEFINHLPVLYKMFVINDQYFLVHRSSIKNIGDADIRQKLGSRYDFDSRLVSSPNATCEIIEALPQENIREQYEPPDAMLTAIKNALTKELGITLFGVDIIKDLSSDDYYIIDVNYFPGYEGIPQFPQHLAQHVLHLMEQKTTSYPRAVCPRFTSAAAAAGDDDNGGGGGTDMCGTVIKNGDHSNNLTNSPVNHCSSCQ